MLPEFQSHSPDSKKEALDLLATLEGGKAIAGGTDLLVKMRRGEQWPHVIDLDRVPGLRGLDEGDGEIRIGAAVTHHGVHRSPLVAAGATALATACGLVGSPQIRNMGTIGGNLVNASPAADSIPPLLIHDGVVTVESASEVRTQGVGDFIVAPYKTTLGPHELLTSITVKRLAGYREGYRRVTKRAAWAISRLSVAWAIREEEGVFRDVRIAIGSCTPMPFRPVRVEEILVGAKNNEPVVRDAVEMIIGTIRAVTGERPSFAYKIPVLKGILSQVLRG